MPSEPPAPSGSTAFGSRGRRVPQGRETDRQSRWRPVSRPAHSGATAGRTGPRVDPLAVVAALYGLLALVLVVPRLRHGLGWDESVYLSQYDPRRPAAFFSAPRSRGTSLLTAPVVALTASTTVLRVVLTVLSSAALYASFRVWRPLLGTRVTALAALLFASLWITVLSGPMAMPNLWVAFGAVGAVGCFLRGRGVPLACCVAGVALFRAPDAVWLVLPMAVCAAAARGRRRMLPFLAAGLAAGLAQWIVEAYARWGGVRARLHVSSATEGDLGLHPNLGTAWHALNGPLLCRPCTSGPPDLPWTSLWWLALPLLAAAAVLLTWRDRRRGRNAPTAPIVLCVACAAALGVSYLLLIGYSAPRFLVPAYALLALPVATVAVRIARPRVLAALVVAVCAVQLCGQFLVLGRQTAETAAKDARYVAAAHGLRSLGLTPPCLVTGPRALPIAYAAGCASAQLTGNNASTTRAGLLRRAALVPTALLTSRGQRPPHYARDWTPYELPGTPGWTAWKAPGREQLPPGP
ncbi:hypothetical protein ACFW9D_09565 [Streptomyces sp. NPDC059524]|uniref:hypothetical protein n=1 Tax=Streptomyces sp. NPDC059524 TaxID=3346856 RepID=UPI00369CBF7A